MELNDYSPIEIERAHALWLKLKEAFNKEAAHYDPETNTSKLGSIGNKANREVLRSMWWAALEGNKYGDYDKLTSLVESLHNGERLEPAHTFWQLILLRFRKSLSDIRKLLAFVCEI